MKPQHKAWAKFFPPQGLNSTGPVIRVIDLPGFRALEDRLLLYSSPRGPLRPEIEKMADDLSLRTFGITREDTLLEWPADCWGSDQLSENRVRAELKYHEFESRFETSGSTEDSAVEVLLRLGLDFRDERKNPLLCTGLFARQAEAAAKGILGRMPDRAEQGIELWENALLREAADFQKSKLAKTSR